MSHDPCKTVVPYAATWHLRHFVWHPDTGVADFSVLDSRLNELFGYATVMCNLYTANRRIGVLCVFWGAN